MADSFVGNSGYPGGAYHPDLKEGRAFGQIRVTPAGITFTGPDVQKSLPTKGIDIRAGGANDQTLFFTHPDAPGWTLFTGNRKILEALNLSGSAAVLRQVGDIRKKGRKSLWILAALLLLLIMGIYGLFRLKEPLCIAIAHRVPPPGRRRSERSRFPN